MLQLCPIGLFKRKWFFDFVKSCRRNYVQRIKIKVSIAVCSYFDGHTSEKVIVFTFENNIEHIYWNTFSCNKTTSFYWSLKHWNCDHHTYIITPHLAVPPTSKSDPGSKNWFMISLWLFGVDRKSIFWRGGYFVWHIFAMNFWHHDSGPTTEEHSVHTNLCLRLSPFFLLHSWRKFWAWENQKRRSECHL